MKILVRDIEWDTDVDGIDEMSAAKVSKLKKAIKRLPDEMIIELDDDSASYEFCEIVSEVIDKVSDATGWLVQDSSVEVLRDSAPPGFDVDAFNQFCLK